MLVEIRVKIPEKMSVEILADRCQSVTAGNRQNAEKQPGAERKNKHWLWLQVFFSLLEL